MKTLYDILADEKRPHIILAHVRRRQMEVESTLQLGRDHEIDYRGATDEQMEELAVCFTFTWILTGHTQQHSRKLNAARRERGLESYHADFCANSRFGVLLANRVKFPAKGIVGQYNDILYAEEPAERVDVAA